MPFDELGRFLFQIVTSVLFGKIANPYCVGGIQLTFQE